MSAEPVTTAWVRLNDNFDSSRAELHHSWLSATSLVVVGAWLAIVVAQVTGGAATLHHHALIEGDTPPGLAIVTFLVAWQVMVVAMMWPASLPAVHALRDRWPGLPRPRLVVAIFLGMSAIVWAGFGLAAFIGDMAVHQVVHTTPWLAARPWLIEAGVLAAAGAYQFSPAKRHYLAACRRPGERVGSAGGAWPIAFGLGLRHGLDCLGSSWALMLVMFAASFASMLSMAVLTALMVYEATGRQGQRAATAAGIALLLVAVTALSGTFSGPG